MQPFFLRRDKLFYELSFFTLQVLDISPSSAVVSTPSPKLTYDREWLAISRALHPFLSTARKQPPLPPPSNMGPLIQESQRWVDENVGEKEIVSVQQFVMTAPGPTNTNQHPIPGLGQRKCTHSIRRRDFSNAARNSAPYYANPQTKAFCEMLGLENRVDPPVSRHARR